MAGDLDCSDGAQFAWQEQSSHLLLNPRLPKSELEFLHELHAGMPIFSAHVWLATSGTTARGVRARKLVGLSKGALLCSAQAVNQILQSHRKDVWISVLPIFHVGGLGIWARAFLAENRVVSGLLREKWDAAYFVSAAAEAGATLSALVPTQVFDLVSAGLRCPDSLRAIIVGGGALAPHLYQSARRLGWPLLPSYGMTECASQVATVPLTTLAPKGRDGLDPNEGTMDLSGLGLAVLPHLEVRQGADEFLQIRGASLLTGYALEKDGEKIFLDPKDHQGWFTTEDRGEMRGEYLHVRGRDQDFVKILGEIVNLIHLESIALNLADRLGIKVDLAIGVRVDPRRGARLCLCLGEGASLGNGDLVLREFNQVVAPFERLSEFHILPLELRNALGKVNRHALSEWLNQIPDAPV